MYDDLFTFIPFIIELFPTHLNHDRDEGMKEFSTSFRASSLHWRTVCTRDSSPTMKEQRSCWSPMMYQSCRQEFLFCFCSSFLLHWLKSKLSWWKMNDRKDKLLVSLLSSLMWEHKSVKRSRLPHLFGSMSIVFTETSAMVSSLCDSSWMDSSFFFVLGSQRKDRQPMPAEATSQTHHLRVPSQHPNQMGISWGLTAIQTCPNQPYLQKSLADECSPCTPFPA